MELVFVLHGGYRVVPSFTEFWVCGVVFEAGLEVGGNAVAVAFVRSHWSVVEADASARRFHAEPYVDARRRRRRRRPLPPRRRRPLLDVATRHIFERLVGRRRRRRLPAAEQQAHDLLGAVTSIQLTPRRRRRPIRTFLPFE